MMRYGRLKGTMEQCIAEIQESQLPSAFLLTQVRSLVRYLREVDDLSSHIKKESGWQSDMTPYLEILCAKEESTLARRVSDTRILKQVNTRRLESQLLSWVCTRPAILEIDWTR